MRITTTRFAALTALAGALACASNKARTDDTTQPSQAAAARDTTTVNDTLGGRDTTQNPPGYRGMERDTSISPSHQQTPSDTFLQKQGQGTPQDTAGYSGIERVDTTGQHQANPSEVSPSAGQTDTTGGAAGVRTDTSGVSGQDTSGMSGMDSTKMRNDSAANQSSSGTGLDSTGMSRTGDTTGYGTSQDTTTSR